MPSKQILSFLLESVQYLLNLVAHHINEGAVYLNTESITWELSSTSVCSCFNSVVH